ncbi:hypothetical protein KW823_10355, partial [Enterobacter quasiroggenkampii]|nr:hypothetical protein [Enterobacter quasiroggenkampii]
SCRGTDRESEPFVRHCLTKAFLECGLPDVLRTDNGQPFAGTGIAGAIPKRTGGTNACTVP